METVIRVIFVYIFVWACFRVLGFSQPRPDLGRGVTFHDEPAKPAKLLVRPSEFLEESLALARNDRGLDPKPGIDLGRKAVDGARGVQLVPQQAGDLGLSDVSPHEDAVRTNRRATTPTPGTTPKAQA